mmetsp:Transcript_989/g.2175  ORF Transcript_989/g.2175 Transcript_989/m.2175 type:complete len:396 (+) Transcript_989:87-1274(+)
MKSAMDVWKKASGQNIASNRKMRLCFGIIGYILVFCGISMQWWSAVRLYSVPLKYLCRGYSGLDEPMTRLEWKNGFDSLAELDSEASSMPLAELTKSIAQRTFGYVNGQGDNMANLLHASPSFWCKYLPECPVAPSTGELIDGYFYFHKDAVCGGGKVLVPGEKTNVGGWPGRSVSQVAHWNMGPRYLAGSWTDTRISCGDKRQVYEDFLQELAAFTGQLSDKQVKDAVSNFNIKCHNEKGPIRYAIGLGPTLSAFAFVFGVLSLICPGSAYISGTAKSFLVMGLAMTFIALWLVAWSVSNELGNYSFCRKRGYPLTANGTLFDSTPCIDHDSWGEDNYNPYAVWTAHIEGMYSSGCITVIVGLILCMVALWKQSESRVAQKFRIMVPDDEDGGL